MIGSILAPPKAATAELALAASNRQRAVEVPSADPALMEKQLLWPF
jgi:hypothetical protein